MRRALANVAGILVAAYVLSQLIGSRFAPETLNLLLWLLGGAVLHDLVFLPLYVVIDRGAQRALGAEINFVRVPVVISGVIALVYFPGILNRQPANYYNALGLERPDYLARWLWLTLALFIASGLVWAARRAAAGRRRTDP